MLYRYPISIKEAAETLDMARPGWYNKIDVKKFNMIYCPACVLGQVYGKYSNGIDLLFGMKPNNLSDDKIFGRGASNEAWLLEINRRLDAKVLNNIEAISALLAGKKICRDLSPFKYFHLVDNKVLSDGGTNVGFDVFNNIEEQWTIYKEPRMVQWDDIPNLGKFKLTERGKVYQRLDQNMDGKWYYDELSQEIHVISRDFPGMINFILVD